MRPSNLPSKISSKYQKTHFKTVEDYEEEIATISDIQRRMNKNKTPILRRRSHKKLLELPTFSDPINSLSLQKEIEIMLKPITTTEKNNNSMAELTNSHVPKEAIAQCYNSESSQPLESKNLLQKKKLKPQSLSLKLIRSQKKNLVFLPTEEPESSISYKTGKHWYFHMPNKHDPLNNPEPHSGSGLVNSFEKNLNESKTSAEKIKVQLHSNSPAIFKNSLLLNDRITSIEANMDRKSVWMKGDNSFLNKKEELIKTDIRNDATSKKQAERIKTLLEDLSTYQVTSNVEDDSIAAPDDEGLLPNIDKQTLLNATSLNGDLDPANKNRLDTNQSILPNLNLGLSKKVNNSGFEEPLSFYNIKMEMNNSMLNDSKNNINMSQSKISSKISSPFSEKKNDKYNKWFMPVKYWNISKEADPSEKRHKELRKDANYFYHNLHNYDTRKIVDPFKKEKDQKSLQQASFESLQIKLRQNVMAKQYKKELMVKDARIPSFLKGIGEGISIRK